MLNNSTDEEKANARLEQIIEIIQNQDKEALRALFSENALVAADDFDTNVDALFVFIAGQIDTWEKPSGPSVSESTDRGNRTKNVSSYYYVTTGENKYFFLIRDILVDTKNRDNVGLQLLLVVKAEDEDKIYEKDRKILYDGNKKIERLGVYLPF